MDMSSEDLQNRPRLRFAPVKVGTASGLRVHDNYAGITYTCVSGRQGGRLGLRHLAIEVDGDRFIDDPEVQQLLIRQPQLAVWADRVSRDGRVPDAVTFTWGDQTLFQQRERVRRPTRETPSLQWVADLTLECRRTDGAPARATVGALAGVNPSTVDRWVDRAVKAGLLTRQPANRPSRSSKETPDV